MIVSGYTVSGCLECDKGWTEGGEEGKQWESRHSGLGPAASPLRLDTTTGAPGSQPSPGSGW